MDTTTVAAPDGATRRRPRLVAVVAAVGAALVLWVSAITNNVSAYIWAVVGLHLVVGAVLIPTLYRTPPGRAAASGLENLAPQGSAGHPGSRGAA